MGDRAAQYDATRETVLRLASAVLLMSALGTLYSWSVFVSYLEPEYGQRAAVSAIFSAAVVFFAVGMVVGPRLGLSGANGALTVCALAAAGVALAGTGHSYWVVFVGFGVLFGLANGLGYSLSLKVVQSAPLARTGTLTGVAVASYMLGSIIGAPLLAASLARLGYGATFTLLAAVLVAVGAIVFALLRASTQGGPRTDGAKSEIAWPTARDYAKLWTCFFFASIAGVTALGHAAPITASFGGSIRDGVAAATLCALGNGVGRLGGGWLCDRYSAGKVIGAAAAAIFAAAAAMLSFPITTTALLGLFAISVGYGCIASALPSAIARTYGAESAGRIYGRIFTAWGAAGLFGPLAAGWLFEWTGDYRAAILITAAAGAIATVAGKSFKAPQSD